MRKWLFALVLSTTLLLFNCAAPIVPTTYDIQGTVKLWNDTALSGVTVTAGTKQATTDLNGNWSIKGLSGNVTVSAQLSGYYIVISGMVSPTKQVSGASTVGFTAYSETEDFGGGTGTQNDPYIIVTAQQLNNIRNNLDKHFKQIKNIDLNDLKSKLDPIVANWEPVGHDFPVSPGPFTGSYDGMGFEIQNMVVLSEVDNYSGFFGVISQATITNIVFKNATVDWNASCSGIFAGSINDSLIDKIVIQDSSISKSTNIGGFAGYTSGSTITNCEIQNITVESPEGGYYLGGFVADANATWFENCSADNIELKDLNNSNTLAAGGFAGYSSINGFKNCSFNGTINATSTYTGGFAGYIEWHEEGPGSFDSFENCSVSGQMYARRNPSQMSGYAGGFAGFIKGSSQSYSFTNCTVKMDIEVNYQVTTVGGFAAEISGRGESFLRCSFEGSISATDKFIEVAGFGHTGLESSFEECFAKFEINTKDDASGFISIIGDANNVSVKNSYAKGIIYSESGSASGFIVMDSAVHPTVQNCYSAVSLENSSSRYAFVYNVDFLTNTTSVDTTDCFYDSDISNAEDDHSTAQGKSTAEMKNQSTYTNWDFTSTWAINSTVNDGYPHLQWEN